jgi:hypothetical protein
MKGYPRWFPPGLYGVLALLLVTGVLLVPTMLAFRFEWDVSWALSGGQRLPVAALHTAISFLALAVLGSLFSIHVRVGWRHGGNRLTGFLLVGSFLGLLLSSLGIFYFGDEGAARISCIVHVVLGLLLFLAFGVHFIKGKKLGRERLRAHSH